MNNQTIFTPNELDYLDTTAIFGSVKKVILTKNFKGGNVNCVFGEVAIDFSNADLSGVAVLDVYQLFAEIKIIVPADWHVQSDTIHLLSELDDKRRDFSKVKNSNKILIITGVSVFAAIKLLPQQK